MKRLKFTNIYMLVITKSDREFFQVAFAVFTGWAIFFFHTFCFYGPRRIELGMWHNFLTWKCMENVTSRRPLIKPWWTSGKSRLLSKAVALEIKKKKHSKHFGPLIGLKGSWGSRLPRTPSIYMFVNFNLFIYAGTQVKLCSVTHKLAKNIETSLYCVTFWTKILQSFE